MGTSISEDANSIQLPDRFFVFYVTVCWCVFESTVLMISDEYFQGMFNGSLLLVAVLGGPGFLLFMLYNCYRKNNVTFLDALFHFFPVLQTVKDKAESLSETAQQAAASFQSSEGIFHFYLIYRQINIYSEQTFQRLGDKIIKIFSFKYFCSNRV